MEVAQPPVVELPPRAISPAPAGKIDTDPLNTTFVSTNAEPVYRPGPDTDRRGANPELWPAVDDLRAPKRPTVVDESAAEAIRARTGATLSPLEESSFPVVLDRDRWARRPLVASPVLTLRTEEISSLNVQDGQALAQLCFQRLEDQHQIVREYGNLARGVRLFWEPTLEHDILVHTDILFRIDGKPIAMAGIYQYPEEQDRLWLSWFGVHPEFRKNGLGAAVLRHMEELAGELGTKRFAAYTDDTVANARCHRFYESLGYTEVGKCVIGGDLMRIYEKTLGFH